MGVKPDAIGSKVEILLYPCEFIRAPNSKSSVIVSVGKPPTLSIASLRRTVFEPVYTAASWALLSTLTSLEKKSCSLGMLFSEKKLN